MTIVVTLPEVQQWLEQTKAQVESADIQLLADTYREIVFAQVSTAYETSGWVDVDTTPHLVRTVISMYLAAAIYKRQYSEESFASDNNYGDELEKRADMLLQGIATLTVILPDEEATESSDIEPAFWPNDSASVEDWPPRLEAGSGSERKFSMGHVF